MASVITHRAAVTSQHSSDTSVSVSDTTQSNMTSDFNDKSKLRPVHHHIPTFFRLVAAGTMGLTFGFMMQKARVFEPTVIRKQMIFSSFIMLKMFLSAVVTSQVGFTILEKLAPHSFHAARHAYSGCIAQKTFITTAVGAALLGAGMTISGACPGMVIIQLGSGTINAIYTLLGIFAGTYVYAYTHPWVDRILHDKIPSNQNFLDEDFKTSYSKIAVPLAVGMAAMIGTIEYFVPWWSDTPLSNVPGSSFVEMYAWSPIVTGIFVGLLQIPAVMLVGDTLGSSASYVTVCAQPTALSNFALTLFGYMDAYRSGVENWWQVIYILTAVGGSLLSETLAITPSNDAIAGVHPMAAFFGGILLMYGSRLAGGCTSGHGLSGMGLLANKSFAAVPAMFGGAIATAVVMQNMGILGTITA